ncbi:Ribosome biogenesis protein tsr1 [Astathelohania contejeani]|uniref:Ribosome biogenesis protein tsr1 n=1 Tax=Astathelohania contejeani TaxID=164912 RepID=A0ABQ7I129_9MICR|nr:Ribosome biogenesis protein tsr1 [Thelohania contejeani]
MTKEAVEQKIITVISLSSIINIQKLLSDIAEPIPNGFGFNSISKKKETIDLFFIDGSILSDQELSYATRASDIVVFLAHKQLDMTDKLRAIKKYLPSYLFFTFEKSDKKLFRKFVKAQFGDCEIYGIDMMIPKLNTMKVVPTKTCIRPYMIPMKAWTDGDFIMVEGVVRKGFLTDKIVCNGSYEFIIEEVYMEDGNLQGNELNKFDESTIEYENTTNEQMEIEEEINENIISEDENILSDSESNIDENENSDANKSQEDDLITKYKDYKGIRSLATCNFVSKTYPPHYANLKFIENQAALEKAIVSQKSQMGDNKRIVLKLSRCFETEFNPKIMVLFNKLNFEDQPTLLNLSFTSYTPIYSNKNILVDLGYRVIKVKPLITPNYNHKVFKYKEFDSSGVLSFIGPITLLFGKGLIFSASNEIKFDKFMGIGNDCNSKDRVIVEEVLFEGSPLKIYKKYCTVRGMFNSKKEVLYYQNLGLFTKNHLNGMIKGPIGTHGIFKAYFNRPVNHGLKIYMAVYKRIFPQ